MPSITQVKIAYHYHRHCARIYHKQFRDNSMALHEEQARHIEQVLQGNVSVPVGVEEVVSIYCEVRLWLEYTYILVIGRLDQAD